MVFDYIAKSGKRRIQGVLDPDAFEVVAALKRRRGGGDELLAFKHGRAWCDVRSPDINEYLKEATGDDYSAKDFRTWARDDARRDRAGRLGRGRGHEDRPQARGRPRGQGGLALPRQHARGLPRLLHRPARDRRLQRRADHPRRARGDRRHRASRASCRSTSPSSSRPCSTCSTSGRRRRLWSGSRPDVRLRGRRAVLRLAHVRGTAASARARPSRRGRRWRRSRRRPRSTRRASPPPPERTPAVTTVAA